MYLPGLASIPPIDRDESRFAQASRQMFESVALPDGLRDPGRHSGGLVVPMVQDRPRLNKPPLAYWLQAACAWVFTAGDPLKDAIWMYRVPGVLCAIATVLMTWRLGLKMFDPRAAWLAAALLAVCPLVVIDAHQARADQALLTTMVAAQFALWTIYQRSRERRRADLQPHAPASSHPLPSRHWWLLWLALALGILAKGPIVPMIVALTVLALCITTRSWRWLRALRPVPGILIVLALVGPWVYAVGERTGWPAYLSIITDETLGRSLEAREGHWGPPGYHTVLLAVLFWPGSLLTLAAIVRAFARAHPLSKQPPGRAAELFCLAWILPAWIVFELIGTKLPHYTMPMYPAIALLSARAVLGAARLRLTGARRVLTLAPWLLIGVGLCVGLPVAPWFIGVRASPWIIPLGVLWILALVLAFALLLGRAGIPLRVASGFCPMSTPSTRSTSLGNQTARRGWPITQAAGIVAIAGSFVFLLQGLLPQTKRLWPSARIMELIGPLDAGSRPIGAAGYTEDSLVFLTRARLVRLDPSQVEGWLGTHDNALAVVPAAPPPDPARLRVLAALRGFNYSTGERVDLVIVERAR